MRSIVALTSFALALCLGGAALACSCRPITNVAEHLAHADAIFRGRVISTAADPAAPEAFSITQFEMLAPLRWVTGWDAPPDIVEVRHASNPNGPQCAIWYAPGDTALVIARVGEDRRLHTSSCDAPRWPENEYRAALHLAPMSTD